MAEYGNRSRAISDNPYHRIRPFQRTTGTALETCKAVSIGWSPTGNGFKIYHMGDTALFGDMKLIGEYYKPDLILIPIGGGQFVMNPADAAYATKNFLKPKYALPFHYATNPFLTGTPQEYMKALGKSTMKGFPINPGEKLEF